MASLFVRRTLVHTLDRLKSSNTRSLAHSAPITALSTTPVVIRPSTLELKAERLNSRNLEIAVRQLHQDGLVVVEDVVPHDSIDQLNTKMVEDALILQARGEKGPFNYNQGNIQQDAPPVAKYFYGSIFTSEPTTWRFSYVVISG
jgi:hypothetical protein